ncbi:MAG: hypothetical protein WKF58_11930 [Ilumatobacteraceae bacterium]
MPDQRSVDGSEPPPRRIGLFGGTFDPPHVGHLVTAVNVAHELDLDLTILMVANVPWQKSGTREITLRSTGWRWSRPPSATSRASVPAAPRSTSAAPATQPTRWRHWATSTHEAELFTIVGDDAAAGLESWTRFGEVIERSRLVVVDRPGNRVELPPIVDWIRVEVPRLEVSSTDLRERFVDGRPLDYLVTEPVLDVIAQRRLYEFESEVVGS